MSLEDSSERFTGPPSTQPAYPYSRQDNSPGMSHPIPAPSLPSMSSLLSRHEHMEPAPQQQTYQPPPHSFQPQYNETKHPLYLSEMNPSAPVQHIYHAPQENANVPHYRAEPVLVPIKPANPPSARPERVPIPPLAQRRQSKKIGQRRDELEKDYVEINRSLAAGQGRANELDRPSGSRPQDPSPFVRREQNDKSYETSTQRETSPRSAPPTAVPISNLLRGNSSELQRSTTTYNMIVRQQPKAARACGFGERDRRVIDPPPILQLVIQDPTLTPEEISARLKQPYLVVHCTLWDPATDGDASQMPGTTDKRQQRRLMGTLVSSPFVGKDEFNVEGCFFTFPDLSVRTPGVYSLKFKLVVLDPTRFGIQGHSAPVNSVAKSEPFQVFNAKDFGGMRASTELTKRLKHQGCLISVKKGNSNSKNSNARDEDDDEDMEEEDDDDQDDMTKPAAKRLKRR